MDNPLMKDFKIWVSKKYEVPVEQLERIVYQCGDVGLKIKGGGEVCNILEYLNN